MPSVFITERNYRDAANAANDEEKKIKEEVSVSAVINRILEKHFKQE